MTDATIASTSNHLSGHLICVQVPVVGNLTCQSCFKPTKLENLEYFVNLINTATYCIFLLQKAGSPISGKELIQHDQGGATDYLLSCMYVRADTKISSCQVNTTSRQGIKQLGIFLDSSSYIFLLFFFTVLGQFYAEIITLS